MLKKVVRTKHGQPRGLVVAVKTGDNEFSVGWSACNLKMDTYNPRLAEIKALGRACSGRYIFNEIVDMPGYMREDYLEMVERGRRYFRRCEFAKERNAQCLTGIF